MDEKTKKFSFMKLLKYLLIIISASVYLIFFVRFFVSCDADISDDVILTKEEKALFEDLSVTYPLYNYQPLSWTNDDGTLQIKNVYYLTYADKLFVTVRFKTSEFYVNPGDNPFKFTLLISDGDKDIDYDVSEIYSDFRFGYGYLRLEFDNVSIDNGKIKEVTVDKIDGDGNVTTTVENTVEGGNTAYLNIYSAKDDERLYTFSVAGKDTSYVQVRRKKVDVKEK